MPIYRRPVVNPQQLNARLRAYGASAVAANRITGETPAETASRRARRNRAKGLAVEGEYHGQGATAVLRREGYLRFPNPGGYTAADIVARRAHPEIAGPPLRAVQCKRVAEFEASALNDAVRRFLGLGRWAARGPYAFPDGTRECWLWLDRHGWVARVSFGPDGEITDTRGERVLEVAKAIERMLCRPERIETKRARLSERLGAS